MLKCTHAGVTWNGWTELCKYHSLLADQAPHTVLKCLARRDGKWGTQVSSLCVTLPSPGNGSNKEQIDRAQWASSLGPKRIGMSSQAEKNGAPKPRGGGGGWQVVAGCIIHGWDMHLLGWWLSLQTYCIYRHPGRTTPCFMYFDLIIGLAVIVFFFLWSCKIHRTENITQKCTCSSAHTNWRYICQQAGDILCVLADACIVTYQHIQWMCGHRCKHA